MISTAVVIFILLWIPLVLLPTLVFQSWLRHDYERKIYEASKRHKEELEALRGALIRLRSDVGLSPKRPPETAQTPIAAPAVGQETQELVLNEPVRSERPETSAPTEALDADRLDLVEENKRDAEVEPVEKVAKVEKVETPFGVATIPPTAIPAAAPTAQSRDEAPRYLDAAPLVLDAPRDVAPYALQSAADAGPAVPQEEKRVDDAPEPKPEPASKPSTTTRDERVQNAALDSLETLIGRKIFGWVGVGLFVLSAAFFVQMAIARGWLNPTIRFFGLVALSGGFLVWARRTYRKGNRRYSEILNGSGVATCLVAGYYARAATIFTPTVSTAIMFAAVFAAFMLASSYRSVALAYVAELVGLVVPVLVNAAESPWTTSIYLILYYTAALLLVARLKRSALALVPWAGTLAFFLFAKRVDTTPDLFFRESTFFLAYFFMFDALDLVLLAFRRNRSGGYGDLLRACTTGLICFALLWRSSFVASRFPSDANQHIDWFNANYGYIALFFFVFFGVLWAVARRCDASFRFNENDDCWKNARAANGLMRTLDLPVMFGVGSFVFLTIAITKLCSHTFAAPACLALSTALFIAAAQKARKVPTPSFVAAIESNERRALVLEALQRTFLSTVAFLSVWGWIYLAFGAIVFTCPNFFPNMYPVSTYLQDGAATNACPFFNATAFPTTLSIFLALGAAWALRRRPDASCELVPDLDARQEGKWLRYGATSSVVFGVAFLLLLSASELFSFVAARAYVAEAVAPGVVGYCALLCFWLFASGLFFAVGVRLDRRGLRALGLAVWTFVAIKLTLRDLAPCRPLLLGQPIAPILFAFNDSTVWSRVPDAAAPLVNAFSLPFVLTALVGIAYSVVLRKSVGAGKTRAERGGGLIVGLWSLALLLAISTFDVAGWFDLQPARFDSPTFYAWHAVWILWLVFALATWTAGRLAKSKPTRVFAYSLLAFAFPCVVVGEFFSGDWRTNYAVCDAFFSVYALPAAAYFIALTAMKTLTSRTPDAGRKEKAFGFGASVAGMIALVTLLSFETFRYFTGKTWFGPDDWTRLIALSILWSFGACVFAALASRQHGRARAVCVCVSLFFLALVFVKYVFIEIVHDVRFHYPFFNSFGFETLFIAAVALGLAFFYRILTPPKGVDAATKERVQTRRNLTLALAIVAVGQLWLGSSFDVYRCARVFPTGGNVEPAFLAQTALSTLWTVFAAALLAVGFWKRASWLRWLAIGLFGVTLLKVLLLDMSYLDSVYRVVAFFVLATGATLASGAYWKHKR